MNRPDNPYTSQPPFSAPLLTFAGDWPLIATKLHPPRPGAALVRRSRLLSRLEAAASRRLVLIKGAAGFGKTTLLVQWHQELCQRGRPVAWLALDQEDDLPQHFLHYLVQALSQVLGGQDAASWSAALARAPSPKAVIASLINRLQQGGIETHLVIDDYHHISHPEIHQALAYLIQHAPAGLQVVLGSRTEPPLPLERLRAQEQLLEIDAAELRFDPGETQRYFSEGLGIALEHPDIQRLQELTEGWAAGMQMAAMSPGLKTNPSATIEQLSQGIRVVSRYFNDIVFQQLPEEVYEFLLRTSILNRLHPDLCDALTGQDNGDEMLHWIERRNLFLSALDERGEWFRYHNLFAETLRARLRRRRDIDQAELHERASRWFAAQGLWSEAVRHALAAGKPESALPHAEAGVQSLAREGDLDTLLHWLSQLPPAAREQSLHLQQTLAWTLAHRFRFDECEQLLDSLEALIRREGIPDQRDALLELQAVRAVCAMLADAPVRARRLSEPLLDSLPREKPWVAGLICNVLSACYLAEARFQEALDVQRHQPVLAAPEDNLLVSVYRSSIMGQIYVRQADLNTGSAYYDRALEQAEKIGGPQSNGAIAIAVQLAEVLYERGQWDELDRLLANRLPLIDRNATLDGFLRTYRARIRQAVARNDRTQAETLVEHAMQIAVQRRWRRLQIGLLGERLRNELYPNGLEGARELLGQLEDLLPKPQDPEDPSHQEMVNQAQLNRARLLLLEKNYEEAAPLLQELAGRLERNGRVLGTFHIHTLRAGALWHLGRQTEALELLRPLLTLGERQGLLHSFIDAGAVLLLPLLQRLRQEQATDLVLSAYIDRLLAHLKPDGQGLEEDLPALSERERQTLLLLADGKTNKEIARVLDISPDTVKWHLKNLYAKLGAANRTQALARARVLGIQA